MKHAREGVTPMMSGETTDSDRLETYPFHTATADGERVAGVLYIGNTGEFYEFQDPDTHDAYALWTNPRNGEEMRYANALDMDVKTVMGRHVRAHVPAGRWAEFREKYVNANPEDMDAWESLATPENPLETLATDTHK